MEITRTRLSCVIFCACALLSYSHGCPQQRQTAVKFTLNSRRNQTGHWIAQVRLEHGAEELAVVNPWSVEVEQSTASCDDLGSVQLVATLTAPPPRAGPGYVLHRNQGYYKLHSDLKTWQDARRTCIQEGAHLAIINSEAEAKVLQGMFKPVSDRLKIVYAFIGFHDLYNEGEYLTVFDEPLSTTGFNRWASKGQPDNWSGNATSPGEDCGSIYTNGGMNDVICTSTLPFICEQDLW